MEKLVYTRKKDFNSYDVNLYVKGTGRHNHENAVVKLGDTVLFNSGKYMGLGLVILNRNTLAVDFINTYNTFLRGNDKTITGITLEYDVNEEGTVSYAQVEKQITKSDEREFADSLYNKIKSLNETSIVILTSVYGWEKYMTNELCDLLATMGAVNIREFKNIEEEEFKDPMYNKWSNQNLVKKRPYYHPYAFIGIPNIPNGMGYESLRNNKANFMSTKNIPQAEILVRLRYYPYHKNYFFDNKIVGDHKLAYSDSYNLVWNSTNFSLLNMMPLLMYANKTLGYNLAFTIYNHNIKKDVIQNKTDDTQDQLFKTAFDNAVFNSTTAARRFTFLGQLYQSKNSTDFTKLCHYNFFKATVLDEKTCEPPYSENALNPQCPLLALDCFQQDIPILKCKTGLAPHICSSNEDFRYGSYEGFT
jgi:hypothetical protein